MKVIWCSDIEDVINMGRIHGFIFYLEKNRSHYYYVYGGVESEMICMAVKSQKPITAKYVSVDDDGNIVTSDKPIMPSCAKIVRILKDDYFEELLKKL
ncbi:MAG: hypothetical protein ACK4GQ_02705 [Candidatus Hadarchaeales archaeon]